MVERPLKERLGAFVYHPAVSIAVVVLILISVGLVLLHLWLPPDDPRQHTIELIQTVITVVFVLEIGLKYHVAPDKLRFLAQYWVDILAIIPWAQSLRVLRILRLLRVFRAAMILSRRVRFMSALFRSAMGEYLVLAMILVTLLTVGSFVLSMSELHERQRARAALDADPDPAALVHARVEGGRVNEVVLSPAALAEREALPERIAEAVNRALDHERAADLPPPQEDLSNPWNAAWATVFFLVATEPMIGLPRTTVGKAVTLAVMFGGMTTFAIFTGVVTALMVNRLKRRMEIDDMDRFHLTDHLVLCGWNNLVPLIVEELKLNEEGAPSVVIVAELEELPVEITRMDIAARIFFVPGDYTTPEVLEQARIVHARRAIIVADTTKPRSDQDRDARTVLAALMIERMNPKIYTCAELLNRANEPHLRAAGIEEVITTSEAGGHHLAMAAMHPGLANVVSELLTSKAGETLVKQAPPDALIGKTFMAAMEQLKREKNALLVGIEALGADGPRTPGYAMRVNPPPETVIGPRDHLVVIGRNQGGVA
ncbi:MAG: ion transporter [Planctomycetes bacterium]|nr:ion transporter [Planctomycetota bacterium]